MNKLLLSISRHLIQWILNFLIHLYRICISPVLGSNCRFTPSCSQYALDAIHQQGAIRGLWLSLKRLVRCHPGAAGGDDPVSSSFK